MSTIIREKIQRIICDEEILFHAANDIGYRFASHCLELKLAFSVLKKLDIEPLNSESVELYKKEEKRKRSWFAPDRDWYIYSIENYDLAVPAFALSRALEIKQEMPSAQFFVETCLVVKDPFLILSSGVSINKRGGPNNDLPWKIYLDVWDEPKFEGRRQI